MSRICLQQFSLDINFTYNEIYQSFFPPIMLLFNWSIVDLQCCVNVCFKAKCFSYTHICVYIHCVCVHILLFNLFFFFFCYTVQHVGLVPWPGIETASPAVEVWSLNHWTATEVPYICFSIMICHRILNTIPCAL